MGRPLRIDGRALKLVIKRVLVPVAVAAGLAGTIVPLLTRTRTVQATEAMLLDSPPIDGQRAYGYLKKICEIGPRTAGSAANKRQRQTVADHFAKLGATVTEQPFRRRDPKTRKELAMANLIGSWFPERNQRVVIGAHYDTRPHPDEEVLPERLKLPFIGANDGASGVALLMEIAHHLKDLNTQWGVDLVLFDGEELVYGNNPRIGEYFLGSEEFARLYARHVDRKTTKMRYAAGFVLDMVGGRNLQIDQEPNSVHFAPRLMEQVWGVARDLDARSFHVREGREVMDDHLALNKAGIPTIDLIDFNYPFWHKANDLPENCSADSLAEVGRVVTGWLTIPRQRMAR
jgi:glutaminyl-peptide cyclotransferase